MRAPASVPIVNSKNDFQRDLEILHEAVNYREWIFSIARPHIGSRILEIGSAIGNYTEKMLDSQLIVASDYEQKYVDILRSRFEHRKNVRIIGLDITQVDDVQTNEIRALNCDTAIAFNVLEHIKDDNKAVRTMATLIGTTGRLVLICPAYQWLFNQFDRSYGHFRRYDRQMMHALARTIDATTEKFSYFNAIGITGWMLNGMLLRRKTLPQIQTKLYDRTIPFIRGVEKVVKMPFGLSIFAVLRKNG
jgi:SAM-dependent methyltransferase